jgi:hypothetical protein
VADRWYYAHGEVKRGPYSGRQLRDLADSGSLVPTDTVWKEGLEKGALAGNVKNLFPPAPAPELAPAEPVPAAVSGGPEPPAPGGAPEGGASRRSTPRRTVGARHSTRRGKGRRSR